MKNIRFLLFLGVLTFSNQSFAQEVSDVQIAFANKFKAAVESLDLNAVLKMTDKAYRKQQVKFLGGRKEQFINELFGGVDILTEEYINIEFANILKIEIAEVIPLENGDAEYIFRIRDGKHDVLRSLLLKKTKNKYGFIGSMG